MDQKASDGRVSQSGFQFLRWLYSGGTDGGRHRVWERVGAQKLLPTHWGAQPLFLELLLFVRTWLPEATIQILLGIEKTQLLSPAFPYAWVPGPEVAFPHSLFVIWCEECCDKSTKVLKVNPYFN